MLFRLQHVSTLFSSICYALLFLCIYTTEYDENENLNLVSLRLWLQQILRTDLRGLRTLDGSESMSGGAKGKAKRANGGLFNLFKWNIDVLEK